MGIRITKKTQKIDSYKTVSQFTIEPYFFSSRHNSKTALCHALLKYDNERKICWDNWLINSSSLK